MDLSETVALLRVLGDETRLRIVHLLFRHQERGLLVGELVEALQLPQPNVSRHLAILREAEFVESEARGNARRYTLAAIQPQPHAALLSALEAFVVDSPAAREDLERSPSKKSLPPPSTYATLGYHESMGSGETAMTQVLSALSHPVRRRIVDIVAGSPGTTVGQVAERFDVTRAAVGKHLAVLDRAGIVLSRRSGRERRLYHNAVPLQLVYDRWTDRFTAPVAGHMAAIKYAVEEGADG